MPDIFPTLFTSFIYFITLANAFHSTGNSRLAGTPHYYGHSLLGTKSRFQTPASADSRYYGFRDGSLFMRITGSDKKLPGHEKFVSRNDGL